MMPLFLGTQMFYIVKIKEKLIWHFKVIVEQKLFLRGDSEFCKDQSNVFKRKIKCIQYQLLGDYIIKGNFVEQKYE